VKRRFSPNDRFYISGIDLRITEGSKCPGDLRLEVWTADERWRPLEMGFTFLTVDFFAENEKNRQQYESFWRQNGDRYFIDRCIAAWRHGWRAVVDELERQKRKRVA
jgi:hypothetical protein